MNTQEVRDLISDSYQDIVFTYNGAPCGVTNEVVDSKPIFQAWCGEKIKYYNDINTVMTDKFYFGKSINDLIINNEVELDFQ